MAFRFPFFGRRIEKNPEESYGRTQEKLNAYANPELLELIDSTSPLSRFNREYLLTKQGAYETSVIELTPRHNLQGFKPSLNEYRWSMLTSPEIAWCIEEILTEVQSTDLVLETTGDYTDLDENTKTLIDKEFLRFKELFSFETSFVNDFLHFIVEGEMAYEAIIDNTTEDKKAFGVIGIRRLYSDDINVIYSPIIDGGLAVSVNLDSVFNRYGDFTRMLNNPYPQIKFNRETGSFETAKGYAVLTFPNVIYSAWNLNASRPALYTEPNYPTSILDLASTPLFQLSALQQAAVVLRTVRAPERLVFNLSTGGMSDKAAVDYIRKFGNSLDKKKVAAPAMGPWGNNGAHGGNVQFSGQETGQPRRLDISQAFNPSTMLESWIFGKSDANDGTTVSSVGSMADFDKMADIEYFERRLLNIFKIPWSRIKDPAKTTYKPTGELAYDEIRFYKFIESIQSRLSTSINRLFIYNLGLRKIGEGENLGQKLLVKFESPERYANYMKLEGVSSELDLYTKFADREEFNKRVLMRKYLNMNAADINAHLGPETEEEREKRGRQLSGGSSRFGFDGDIGMPSRFSGGGGGGGGGLDDFDLDTGPGDPPLIIDIDQEPEEKEEIDLDIG